MKTIFKCGVQLSLKLIVVTLLCLFLSISISVLCTAVFTENIGYTAYGYVKEGDDAEYLYTYYEADGEDTKRAEYEAQGYTVTTANIRSSLEGKGNVVFLTVTQLFCLLMLFPFVYTPLYSLGFKDSNLVRFKHAEQDLFKGLKIGLLANIPYIALYIALAVFVFAGSDMPVAIYKILNGQYFSFIDLITKSCMTVGEISIWQLALLLILLAIVPAIATVSYILGYKGIDFMEKIVYKKKA